MRESLEFSLGEILLDTRRYGPDAARRPRNRWRNAALVNLFASLDAGRQWLYQLIDRLDPPIARGVQAPWLHAIET